MDYFKLLETSLAAGREHDWNRFGKHNLVADGIFDLTLYDSGMSKIFSDKIIEVCDAITNRNTFDYIKNKDNYKWYLTIVNMPFFSDKLTWGSSIRGAWWDIYGDDKFKIDCCCFYDGELNQILGIEFNKDEWYEFLDCLISFYRSKDND